MMFTRESGDDDETSEDPTASRLDGHENRIDQLEALGASLEARVERLEGGLCVEEGGLTTDARLTNLEEQLEAMVAAGSADVEDVLAVWEAFAAEVEDVSGPAGGVATGDADGLGMATAEVAGSDDGENLTKTNSELKRDLANCNVYHEDAEGALWLFYDYITGGEKEMMETSGRDCHIDDDGTLHGPAAAVVGGMGVRDNDWIRHELSPHNHYEERPDGGLTITHETDFLRTEKRALNTSGRVWSQTDMASGAEIVVEPRAVEALRNADTIPTHLEVEAEGEDFEPREAINDEVAPEFEALATTFADATGEFPDEDGGEDEDDDEGEGEGEDGDVYDKVIGGKSCREVTTTPSGLTINESLGLSERYLLTTPAMEGRGRESATVTAESLRAAAEAIEEDENGS